MRKIDEIASLMAAFQSGGSECCDFPEKCFGHMKWLYSRVRELEEAMWVYDTTEAEGATEAMKIHGRIARLALEKDADSE